MAEKEQSAKTAELLWTFPTPPPVVDCASLKEVRVKVPVLEASRLKNTALADFWWLKVEFSMKRSDF
jgi:hypothetical protein